MEGEHVVELGGRGRNRNDKGRRGWSVYEEQVLSEAMKRIIHEGWKSENGFRTGFLTLLASYMKQVLPNTDIEANPHINSRITVWKKNYSTLFEILKNTGVGLDSTTKMIEATEEQWTTFIKKDPNARLMRYKSWPLYGDWCEIFGNTRATGAGAQDFVNAAAPPPEMVNVPPSHPPRTPEVEMDHGSNKVNTENQDESQSPSSFTQTGESSDVRKASSGRKRKNPTTPDPFVNIMNDFCETASARLGEIAQRIGYEQDMCSARKSIYKEVSTMNMLSKKEMMRVTSLIARNNEYIDVFFSLPVIDRMEWVLMLLNGDI